MDPEKEALAKSLEMLKVKKEGKALDHEVVKKVRRTAKDAGGEGTAAKDKKGKAGQESRRELDLLQDVNLQGMKPSDLQERYRFTMDKIDNKKKEIKRSQDDLDQRQERFMKRRAKLQEILAELEKDLNVRLGKEKVKKENEEKMKGKQREITDLIDAIPQKTKKMIDAEMEEYSKAFNTQVQNMKKEMSTYLASQKEYLPSSLTPLAKRKPPKSRRTFDSSSR
jgi:hypothetical protein